MEQSNNMKPRGNGGPKMPRFNMTWLFTICLITMIILFFTGGGDAIGGSAAKEATYTQFKQYVDKGYVLSVVANKTESTLKIYINPKYTRDVYNMPAKSVGPNPYVKVQFGSVDEVERYANQMLKEKKIRSFSYDNQKDNDFLSTLFNLAPLLFFVFFILWMSGRFSGGMGSGGMGGGIFSVGKSKAKMYEKGNAIGITFKDVAGQEGAKQEVKEIVDFLKNPQKYTDLGGKIPKGALLVGPPGTGKTLLAKAVAGEAGVPFFSMSGSDFVEMFVGVGASRVRDLFRQAKEKSPCIIFIDEIDAIGKSRDSRFGGGNDEREQTLNQLLAEMDGFDSSKGILMIAATNRPEVLDKALLRPGRFDRRIIVDKPDLKGRLETLKVHSKDVHMDETVDLDALALATAGLVGSDLANMINEAAIIAVKNGRQFVNQSDLFEAFELVAVGGKEKKDRIMSDKERKIVSYHEVGHALVSALQKNSEPVQKITIVPRTMGALGYTLQTPEEEKYLQTKDELIAKINTYMAGRAAEVLVFNSATSGAANDIENATKIARAMVTMYGMSDRFGMMCLATVENQYLDGRAGLICGEETSAEIDKEVLSIINKAYEDATNMLIENRAILDRIAEYLYEKETITGKEFMKMYREMKGLPDEEEAKAQEAAKTTPASEAQQTPENEVTSTVQPVSDDAEASETSAAEVSDDDIFEE